MAGITQSSLPISDATPHRQSMTDVWRPVLIEIVLGIFAILLAHGSTVLETISIWNRSPSHMFSWVVGPTLLYLIWHNRQRLAHLTPAPSGFGVAFAATAGALWIAGDLMNIAEGRQFALVAAMVSIVLAAVGWAVFRALTPFLAMLVFLIPTSEFLLPYLKVITVGLSQGFAAIWGLPFKADGYSFTVGTETYFVIDYCVALPYVLMGLFFGQTLGLLIYRSWWKIAALALLGAGLAILTNGMRIMGIFTYDYLTGSVMTVGQHIYFEMPALALNFAVLFFIFSRLKAEPFENADRGPMVVTLGATVKSSGLVLIAVALISSAPFIWRDTSGHATEAATSGMLPAFIADWTRVSTETDWQPRSRSKTVETVLTDYVRGDRRVSVFVAQAASRRDKVSGGANDLVGGGDWRLAHQRKSSVCLHDRCDEIRHMTIPLEYTERVRHVFYTYALNGVTTVSPLRFRLDRAWATLKGETAIPRLIAIATEEADSLTPADVATLMQALAR